MYDLQTIMRGLLWVAYVLYVFCFVPQVLTNIERKSTAGVSNATIFIYFYGYLIEVLYAYFLGLPLALRVMIPVGAGVAGTLVLQRFYYDPDPWLRFRAAIIYATALMAVLLLAVLGVWYPWVTGHLAGWVGTIMWFIYQIPQAWKVYKTKSVEGFNFFFIIIAIVGAVIEIIAGILIPLPPQAVFNGSRGLLFCCIFIWQFSLYHKRSWREWLTFK
ncbi:MAG: PQ-loop repeat-containing protein [Candidatus Dependentiae bacterium]|jgi:uncharacterized protein with PQ loop repeat